MSLFSKIGNSLTKGYKKLDNFLGENVVKPITGKRASEMTVGERLKSTFTTGAAVGAAISTAGVATGAIAVGSGTVGTALTSVGLVSKGSSMGLSLNKVLNIAKGFANGINAGQARVTGAGGIAVPSGQSGSGLFSSLTNLAANVLGGGSNKLITAPAASVGGIVPIAGGGGIVVGGSGQIGDPVNQKPSTSTTGQMPPFMWAVIAVGVFVLLKVLKIVK